MKYNTLIIEKKEYDLIKRIISMGKYQKDDTYKTSISKLKEELTKAQIVKKDKLPNDVIRFNSYVTIKTPFLEKTYQLVTPEHSDLKNNKISFLAPMGLALFGYAKDDEITWHFPSGESTIKIIDVTQTS
ncbi:MULTISPECIES: GreA/GreB family elongation factor [Mesonia]|uniref:Regulator of nucleoside diphosphate kinase n=1 Tax=Mesonia algae TaxID=213248 RepID=A0A2W7IJR3_9FLAO|nr:MULTISPECIES: GreA/GreB family elongation factor [Mesonia]PZW39607.1 regulator of nucleoside diphosphate kinase [Mesonia algae]TXK76199.1 GreA/GreB family elongation factor [Mesonia sp. K4-1]